MLNVYRFLYGCTQVFQSLCDAPCSTQNKSGLCTQIRVISKHQNTFYVLSNYKRVASILILEYYM